MRADRYEEAADSVRDGLALARRVGNRYWETCLLASAIRRSLSAAGTRCWRCRPSCLKSSGPKPARPSTSSLRLAFSSTSTEDPMRRRAGSSSLRGIRDLLRHPGTDVVWLGNRIASGPRGVPPTPCGSPRLRSGPADMMGVTIEYVKEAFVVAVEAALELNDVPRPRSSSEPSTAFHPDGIRSRCVRSRRGSRRGWRAIQRMRNVISRARPVSSASSQCPSTSP